MAVALDMAGSAAAFADSDVPGADWMPEDQVIQKLEAAGYTNVTGLQADDGHWEGKGVRNGVITEFEVNPHTGELLKEEVDRD
ncbi:PepSY domain-containing protein [Hyphomicrobium sp.]|uniref:PepSY domain-containing protein n=1 Tax=Hyphomicrobium sp. TaxID=82 RepID=UPI0025C4401C|nr:PepSY domain-containing protein [Hyphomicrobium sp.]